MWGRPLVTVVSITVIALVLWPVAGAAGALGAYATMLLAVSFRLASFNVLLGLLSIPVGYSAFRILNENYMDKFKMIPANLATIKVHALTLSYLIIGYLAEGLV